MAIAYPVGAAERRALLSSSDPELSAGRDGSADLNETTPLLRTNRPRVLQWNYLEWWSPARSAASAFVDENSGLLLIAASQFFFSGMNLSVKLLNSLDEPVPTLEVGVSLPVFFFSELTLSKKIVFDS
jgi:hypothetical protein